DGLQPVLVQGLEIGTDLRGIRAEVRARGLRGLLLTDDGVQDRLGGDVLRRHEQAVMRRAPSYRFTPIASRLQDLGGPGRRLGEPGAVQARSRNARSSAKADGTTE